MTVTETTDTTSVHNKVVKKFTTNLSPGGGQDSTTWTCPSGVTSIRYLIVAGGGSGGNGSAGGGGAGGLLTGNVAVVPGSIYTIKVGAGGAATIGQSTYNNGNPGANSEFVGNAVSFISVGGGGGICYNGPADTTPRGSGGGGSASGSYLTGGVGTSGQGYNGGNGYSGRNVGGGGGGAGAVGGNAGYDLGGNGGAGLQSDITGTALYYAGGGGGCRAGSSTTSGLGGSGIGGIGGYETQASVTAGAANTGSGGGGHSSIIKNSGAGGSGVVILQYSLPTVWMMVKA